jgi:hypothetical protein
MAHSVAVQKNKLPVGAVGQRGRGCCATGLQHGAQGVGRGAADGAGGVEVAGWPRLQPLRHAGAAGAMPST